MTGIALLALRTSASSSSGERTCCCCWTLFWKSELKFPSPPGVEGADVRPHPGLGGTAFDGPARVGKLAIGLGMGGDDMTLNDDCLPLRLGRVNGLGTALRGEGVAVPLKLGAKGEDGISTDNGLGFAGWTTGLSTFLSTLP
jgi:hypothetical protein